MGQKFQLPTTETIDQNILLVKWVYNNMEQFHFQVVLKSRAEPEKTSTTVILKLSTTIRTSNFSAKTTGNFSSSKRSFCDELYKTSSYLSPWEDSHNNMLNLTQLIRWGNFCTLVGIQTPQTTASYWLELLLS